MGYQVSGARHLCRLDLLYHLQRPSTKLEEGSDYIATLESHCLPTTIVEYHCVSFPHCGSRPNCIL